MGEKVHVVEDYNTDEVNEKSSSKWMVKAM